tara:strand:+ start:958 stop:1380 length:423 start_codon:yes stop_codon:yes gene_type:complete
LKNKGTGIVGAQKYVPTIPINMMDISLKIPEFLVRKKKRGRPRKIHTLNHEENSIRKYEEWDLIKRNKYGYPYTIYFNDEAPRIGSGVRKIYVKEGRKWVHLFYHPGDPNTTFATRSRLRLLRWKILKQSHEEYLERNKI